MIIKRPSFALLLMGTLVACSNQTVILSTTEDTVTVRAKPERFVEAYTMASEYCERNDRYALYEPVEAAELNILQFNCLVAESEEASEEFEETGEALEEPIEELEETADELQEPIEELEETAEE